MALMMCRTYVERNKYTAVDLLDLGQQEIRSYPQSLRNKSKGSGKALKSLSKTRFTSKSTTEQGTLSQQHEEDNVFGDNDKREKRNN